MYSENKNIMNKTMPKITSEQHLFADKATITKKYVESKHRHNINKMKTKSYIIIAFVLLTVMLAETSSAQQDPMYTQYMFNLSPVNSAAIGRADNISLMSVSRFQWVGVEGAPTTHSLSADIPVKFFNSGIGLSFVQDKLGPEKSSSAYLDYAYHIKVSQRMKLGMGIKAGFKVYSANLEALGHDGVIDDLFTNDINGDFMPNFGLGLMLYADEFYFGISSPSLVNHKYEGTDDASGKEERHFFLIGGYVLPLNNDIIFKPSVYSKYVKGAPLSYDITANFLFREKLWAGVSYRSGDAIGIITQIELFEQLRVGYAYDIGISQMRKASSGSHEIMLNYFFSSKKDLVRSPRYF